MSLYIHIYIYNELETVVNKQNSHKLYDSIFLKNCFSCVPKALMYIIFSYLTTPPFSSKHVCGYRQIY